MKTLTSVEELYELYKKTGIVSTDTRNIPGGCIFFGLKGPNFNGSQYAGEALLKGAAYAIVDEDLAIEDERIYKTANTLDALQQLSNHHRKQLSIPIIAIGGSNGKTTTKELLKAVLSKKYKVLATQGNLNNHIGVPLTLLAIEPTTEIAVIEMGTNQPGDMEMLCDIADPDYGIVTNIGKEHLEGFGDLEGVAREESVLYNYLLKQNGLAFINANDAWLVQMAARLTRTFYYGYEHPAFAHTHFDYKGELINANPFIECRLPGTEEVVKPKLSGEYNFQNILAAGSIGFYFGIEPKEIKEAVETYQPTNNRSQVVQKGTNLLFMDCYNANPSSMEVALRNFAAFDTENKIVVIGDMFELGEHAPAEHEAIARLCRELGFTNIYSVGPLFAPYSIIMGSKHYMNASDLKDHFVLNPLKNSYVLFKASRGMTLEKAAEGIV